MPITIWKEGKGTSLSAVCVLANVAWDAGTTHFTGDKTKVQSLNDVLEHGRAGVRPVMVGLHSPVALPLNRCRKLKSRPEFIHQPGVRWTLAPVTGIITSLFNLINLSAKRKESTLFYRRLFKIKQPGLNANSPALSQGPSVFPDLPCSSLCPSCNPAAGPHLLCRACPPCSRAGPAPKQPSPAGRLPARSGQALSTSCLFQM